MKKKILMLALVLVSITGSGFAADAPVISKNVLISFNREFNGAQNVKWETFPHFVKASFEINNMVLYAYYTGNGDLLATCRFISPSQLPMQLLSSLKKDYPDYWISDLFEIHDGDGTVYYATIENSKQKRVLKANGSGDWEIFQITNKQ